MIPDENESFEPEELIKVVNSHVYFLKRSWLSAPRKIETREGLEALVQFKAVCALLIFNLFTSSL